MKDKILKYSVSDQAYHNIKESILCFKRKPGDKLNIDELCKTLELSNTPIREAIKRLQQDGIVEQRLNSGFYVKKITKKETDDYSQIIRIMVLGSIDELIVTGKIKDIIDILEKQLQIQSQALTSEDSFSFLKESIKFDQIFIKSLNNEVLLNRVEKLNEMFSISVFVFHQIGNNKEESIADHKKMIEAVKAEDYTKLKQIIREHYILGTSEELYKF